MCSKSELRTILKEIREIYEKVYGKKLIKVLLYGSYARGDFNEESDIDIIGLVNESRIKTQASEKMLWELTTDIDLEYGVVTSLTAVPYNEYKRYVNDIAYYKNIEKEGVEIVA